MSVLPRILPASASAALSGSRLPFSLAKTGPSQSSSSYFNLLAQAPCYLSSLPCARGTLVDEPPLPFSFWWFGFTIVLEIYPFHCRAFSQLHPLENHPPEEGTYPEWPRRYHTCVSIRSHCYLCSGTSESTLSCRATIANETSFLAKLPSIASRVGR